MAFAPVEKDFHSAPNGHLDQTSPSDKRLLGYEIIPADPAFMLLFHPVYRGEGVPKGDGSPIMYIPGLCGSDTLIN